MPAEPVRSSPVPLFVARDDDPSGLRMRTSARFVRIRRAVYAPTELWDALKPWERYLARVHAYAAIAVHPIFALESAAALQGLPLFGEPSDIHVFDPDRRRSTRYGDVVVHTSVDDRRIVGVSGVTVTSPLDTAVDLGRVLPPAFGLSVWDAVARGSTEPRRVIAQLVALAQRSADARGRRRLRWLGERVDPLSESVGESVSRAVIEWLGFSRPELQHQFFLEGEHDRCDFFWRSERIVGESDGYGKYEAPTAAQSAQRLVEEKKREDRLRRHNNGLARWDWAVAMRGQPLAARLVSAGLSPRFPLNNPMLSTLNSNRRSLPTSRDDNQSRVRDGVRRGESRTRD